MRKLDGRIAIITGGGKGIGRATAERFAAEGAKVVVATRTAGPGKAVVDAITENGGDAHLIVADVGSRTACRNLVAETAERFGQLDIVLHNAAYAEGGMLDTTDDSHLDRMFEVGLKPCFWLTVDALPYLEKSLSPRILITSSVTGNRWVSPGRGAYSAMKCGVNGFIRSAAIELAKRRITVNGVEPGLTLTDGNDALMTPETIAEMEAVLPMGRAVRSDEIAGAFVYLASDEAALITGQTIVMDGGSTLGFSQPMAFDDH